ncbi:MAG: hypothetical protein LBE62_13080 [Azonexus sp.]|jgi:hypothetical protein|nr:hypothetical protein [Azonexus sp.]
MSAAWSELDARYPYRLSDDGVDLLLRADALLVTLAQLAGQAAVHDAKGPIQISLMDLHRALLAVFRIIQEALKNELINHKGEPAALAEP